jgi:poly(3-hydroxybutyrate) depolymerase
MGKSYLRASAKIALASLLCLTLISKLRADDKPQAPAHKSTTSRIQTRKYEFKEADKEMPYCLYCPTTYDKSKKTPLIVALHGLYATPTIMMHYPDFTELAEKNGYIVAAPMGYNTQGWYGNAPPFGKPNPENLYDLSEKDVMNVLGIVRKEFNVDSDRIYLMGHSMGGGGTFYLGAKYPNIWAALAPIAPAIFQSRSSLEKMKDIPVILFQGEKDALVKVERVRPWAQKMKDLKMTCEYVELPDAGHIDIASKQNMVKIFDFFNHHKKNEKKD